MWWVPARLRYFSFLYAVIPFPCLIDGCLSPLLVSLAHSPWFAFGVGCLYPRRPRTHAPITYLPAAFGSSFSSTPSSRVPLAHPAENGASRASECFCVSSRALLGHPWPSPRPTTASRVSARCPRSHRLSCWLVLFSLRSCALKTPHTLCSVPSPTGAERAPFSYASRTLTYESAQSFADVRRTTHAVGLERCGV